MFSTIEAPNVEGAQADFFNISLPLSPPAPRAPTLIPVAAVKPSATRARTAKPAVKPQPIPEPEAPDATEEDLHAVFAEIDDEDSAASGTYSLDVRFSDEPETIVAKRMFRLLLADLSGTTSGEPDLFGQIIDSEREIRKFDALTWLYNLNPDGAQMSFDWVCDELGIDPEAIRRMTAANMRAELKRLLHVLSCMVSPEHAKNCECELAEYVNLAGWNAR
ncbi:hypothetical protein [Noviherbaspirillum pedocola]|uniref:Uncharacterized protein n=1 Tax=Noviherbaspirillum pedocola TaxID=2801341 RepID=A0A934W266_9BURK|nr:hypothetical protein [Noviherbaspirillum pedocola]MBK4735971.1 hypothetical protein [Noviherbaspirillum pedocola]